MDWSTPEPETGGRMQAPYMLLIALLASLACSPTDERAPESPGDTIADTPQDCPPLETREPNAPEQEPAFEGQTRACEAVSDVAFDVQVLTDGLEHPWAVEPLPDGGLLVTERPGRMRIVSAAG